LPAARRCERRTRRSPCPGHGGGRPAAVGDAAALALLVRVVPPHPEQGDPPDRGDRAAHPLRRPASFDPVLDREGRSRPRAHQRAGPRLQRLRADAGCEHRERGAERGRPPARGVRLPAARRPARSGPARIPARHPTPLLSHRRPGRGRVLRPPAPDGAGRDGVRYRIRHRTSYRYASEVFESFNEVRLQPLAGGQQTLLDFDLLIEPTSDVVTHAEADEPLAGPAEGKLDASPPIRELAGDEALADDLAEFLGP